MNHTPGPWFVRTRERNGEILDCFVAAKDVNGFAYDAEILGDDEYRNGIERRLADCHLISAAPELLEIALRIIDWNKRRNVHFGVPWQDIMNAADDAISKAQGGKK